MYEVIKTEPREVLLSIEFIEQLAQAVSELNLSRRKTPDWLADVLFDWIEHGGVIVDECGCEVLIEDDTIDEAHGRDGSFSYVSLLRNGVGKRRQRRSRQSLLLRFRLYDAAFKIIERPVMSSVRTDGESSGQLRAHQAL